MTRRALTAAAIALASSPPATAQTVLQHMYPAIIDEPAQVVPDFPGSWIPNLPLIGGPDGRVTQGTRSGNTTAFVTVDEPPVAGNPAVFDAAGGLVNGAAPSCSPAELHGIKTANSGAANDAALSTYWNSLAGGSACLQFGPGAYNFAAPHSYTYAAGPNSIALHGAGRDITVLNWPAGVDGFTFNYGDCVNNSTSAFNLTFATASIAANTALTLACPGGLPNTVTASTNTIQDVSFRDPAGYTANKAWGVGVQIRGVSNVNFIGLNQIGTFGTGPGTAGGVGVALEGSLASTACSGGPCYGTIYNFFGCNFDYGSTGILYGSYIQGVSVSASNFVGGNFGIASPPSQTGTLDQLTVTGSQFNAATADIEALTTIDNVLINGNFFIKQLSPNATAVSGLYDGLTLTGNQFYGGAGTGEQAALINTGSTQVLITGNSVVGFNNGFVFQSTTGVGSVQSNLYSGVTTPTSPGATTGNVKIGGGSS